MKCKYYKKCKLYDENSHTCNVTGGMYGDRQASCKIKKDVDNDVV